MVKTDLTGISGVIRSLLHSKITRQQQAIKLLSEKGNNRRDSLGISDSARSFSKESIAALIDKSANVSASELSYYLANYNNSGAILDAINFGENVSCGYNPDFKDYGVSSFDYNGSRQVVPNYAVPKINTSSLSGICAVNNSLVLQAIKKMEQKRSRLTKAWSSKQQMAEASSAYDANIMTETIAGSASLLG